MGFFMLNTHNLKDNSASHQSFYVTDSELYKWPTSANQTLDSRALEANKLFLATECLQLYSACKRSPLVTFPELHWKVLPLSECMSFKDELVTCVPHLSADRWSPAAAQRDDCQRIEVPEGGSIHVMLYFLLHYANCTLIHIAEQKR